MTGASFASQDRPTLTEPARHPTIIGEVAAPCRIQRSRQKGWRMPEGAIYVGRPSLWGNRYRIGTWSNMLGRKVETVEEAIWCYAENTWEPRHMRGYIREVLKGHDLVCWCRLDRPCHADFLLAIANGWAE